MTCCCLVNMKIGRREGYVNRRTTTNEGVRVNEERAKNNRILIYKSRVTLNPLRSYQGDQGGDALQAAEEEPHQPFSPVTSCSGLLH